MGLLLKRCGTIAVASDWVGFVVRAPQGTSGDSARYLASSWEPLFLMIAALTRALSCWVVCVVNGSVTGLSVPQTLLAGMTIGGAAPNLASARRILSTVGAANAFIPSSARSRPA